LGYKYRFGSVNIQSLKSMEYESNGSLEEYAEIQKPTQENSKTKKKPEKKPKVCKSQRQKDCQKKKQKARRLKKLLGKKV